MKRLLVTQRLFDDSLEVFGDGAVHVDVRDSDEPMSPAELSERLRGYDGVICLLTDRIDRAVLEANPQLAVVANVAVGYDNIDVATAVRLGITVTNTPGVLTETTADLTLALMLAVARRIPESDTFVRSGKWTHWKLVPEQLGVDLHGATLGLFGMGRIGRAVARRAVHGFGMRVLYHGRRRLDPAVEAELGVTWSELDDLLTRSDFVSLHAPLTEQTRHLIDADALARMKPTAVLINTSRGPLVDEAALVEALRSGGIAGAGLDVYEDEPDVHPGLVDLRERVVLLPHLGSATADTRRRMVDMAVQNVLAVLTGRRPPNLVDPAAGPTP